MVTKTVDALGDLTVSSPHFHKKTPHDQTAQSHSPQVMVANAGIIIPKPMMDTDLAEFSLILNVRKIPRASQAKLDRTQH